MFGNVYKALADPTRRRVLELLRERDMSAGELADHFDSTRPTLSRHFSVLREADLIQGERQGASIIYSLNVSVLEEALLEMMNTFQINLEDIEARQEDDTGQKQQSNTEESNTEAVRSTSNWCE